MSDRFFLYIDILGFSDLIRGSFDVTEIYRRIDSLNVHRDRDFTCIVFSDTVLVYGSDAWTNYPSQALMWLIEFAQDLFHRLISLDRHIRAYVTRGHFEHQRLTNIDAYYGRALIECYEREKSIKCTGVFLDSRLAAYSDIFHLTEYDSRSQYVHVMQLLDQVSRQYDDYPMDGGLIAASGLEWQTAYCLRYLQNVYRHATDDSLSSDVRLKFQNAWKMIAARHDGLCRRLIEANFEFRKVIDLDWTEMFRRIGTNEGAFG